MPVKKQTHPKYLNPIKRLKKNHKGLHKVFVVVAIVVIWRAVWTIADWLFADSNPVLTALLSAGIAILFLFIDDFKLKEIER